MFLRSRTGADTYRTPGFNPSADYPVLTSVDSPVGGVMFDAEYAQYNLQRDYLFNPARVERDFFCWPWEIDQFGRCPVKDTGSDGTTAGEGTGTGGGTPDAVERNAANGNIMQALLIAGVAFGAFFLIKAA